MQNLKTEEVPWRGAPGFWHAFIYMQLLMSIPLFNDQSDMRYLQSDGKTLVRFYAPQISYKDIHLE